MASLREWTSSQKRSAMARVVNVQGITQFYLPPTRYPQMYWTIPAFTFPAEAGPHLPTPEGRKAELA